MFEGFLQSMYAIAKILIIIERRTHGADIFSIIYVMIAVRWLFLIFSLMVFNHHPINTKTVTKGTVSFRHRFCSY